MLLTALGVNYGRKSICAGLYAILSKKIVKICPVSREFLIELGISTMADLQIFAGQFLYIFYTHNRILYGIFTSFCSTLIIRHSGLTALTFPHIPRGVTDGHRLFDINGGFLCSDRSFNFRL